MKKNEDAATKKRPKTSAAQIRVQKGMYWLSCCVSWIHEFNVRDVRSDRTWPPSHHEDGLPGPYRSPELHSHHHPWWRCFCWILKTPTLLTKLVRHVQGWCFHFLIHHQHQLSTRTTQGQVHANSVFPLPQKLRYANLLDIDIPSKRWPRGKRVFEYSPRRLETCLKFELGHGRPTIPFLGA